MPRQEKATAEEKARIARDCIDGKLSQSEASRRADVNLETIRRWVKRYEAEGAAGFLPYERNRKYEPVLKREAIAAYLQGDGSLQDICKEYKIRSAKQLSNWIKVYNAHGDFYSVKQSGGGSYMKQGRDTTKDERLEIVKDCLASGKNYWRVYRTRN